MRYILFIIMMIQGILCHAAICKHVSGGTETDNRSVLKIQKDLCGIYVVFDLRWNKPL